MRKFSFIVLLMMCVCSATVFAQQAAVERLLEVPDINGLAVSLVKPAFPETAVAVDADGRTVSLRVIVDENGNVLSATCSLTCHSMLKDAAQLAAMTSKFKPLRKDGRPIKYQGALLYTFVVNRVDWFRFGTAVESTRQFDNISLGPVAQILSADFAKEKAALLTLDANGGADYDTRQKVLSEVISLFKSKLEGFDLWRFELGLALRRVTFWPQAGGPIDRAELQETIDGLAASISSAPEGVSQPLIKELTAISKYRVSPDISERDLRQAIFNLSRNVAPYLR
ncbi:MAG: energy transducer TonB [Pyrinomonadaceae bacterium]